MSRREIPSGLKPTNDMLTAQLLALLNGWSAYRYDLLQQLEAAGYRDLNKGSVYRLLRQMERSGLVYSAWDTSTDGPARRVYTVTQSGLAFLEDWLAVIDAHRKGLELLLGIESADHPDSPHGAAAARPRRRSKSNDDPG